MPSYSEQIKKIVSTPETVSEAVNFLMAVLNDGQKNEIAALQEDELFDLHFTLGLAIRNAFGLHDLKSPLFIDCNVEHPDDSAGVIIQQLWLHLKYSGF